VEVDGMLTEYIEAALAEARYELIQDDEPYYGEVPGLRGIWATGKTVADLLPDAQITAKW